MKKLLFPVLLLTIFFACNTEDPEPTDGYEGYTLVWSDEFNSILNPDNWVYEVGDGTDYGLAPGWGNAERQLYTSSSQKTICLDDRIFREFKTMIIIIIFKKPS